MNKADYRGASPEEREDVIAILERNLSEMEKHGHLKNAKQVREIVSGLMQRIRNGDVIQGRDFERLILIFRKKSPE